MLLLLFRTFCTERFTLSRLRVNRTGDADDDENDDEEDDDEDDDDDDDDGAADTDNVDVIGIGDVEADGINDADVDDDC